MDIVFLDLNLPDGNGPESIESIRQHPDHPEISSDFRLICATHRDQEADVSGLPAVSGPALGARETLPLLKDHIEQTKAAYVRRSIAVTRGDVKDSCRPSGLSREHSYRLMKQYGITPHADS